MSLQTYQKTQTTNETTRQTEYRLFLEITRELMDAKDKAEESHGLDSAFHKALYRNRELWSVLSTDCAVEGNSLPDALRAQIISLAIWIGKYTSQVARGEGDITDLIDINKTVMEGLKTAPQIGPEQGADDLPQGQSIKV